MESKQISKVNKMTGSIGSGICEGSNDASPVSLTRTYKYKYKSVRVGEKVRDEHRLLMEAHLGRPLGRNEAVHHINGNGHDNRIENLRLMSTSDHMRMHRLRGDVGMQISLTAENVLEIMEWRKFHATIAAIGERFRVSDKTIYSVISGYSWNHITGLPCARRMRRQ